MSAALLQDIEQKAKQLTAEEQLRLIEHLVRGLRSRSASDDEAWAGALAAMAADPHIQAEIRKINEEFAATESDGLVGP